MTARVSLDADGAGVEGMSFAVCHATGDVVLDGAALGASFLEAAGEAGADFVAVRAGGSPGEGFVTMTAVLDFEGRAVFPQGIHEILTMSFAARQGGTGGSLHFCAAGEPEVETFVARGGRSFVPETRVINEVNGFRVGAESGGWPTVVPVYLTTDRPGLTGFTLLLCHDENEVFVEEVQAAPEILPFRPAPFGPGGAPSLRYDNLCHEGLFPGLCQQGGVRVTVDFGVPLPAVYGLPVLLLSYGPFGLHQGSSGIPACRLGVDIPCNTLNDCSDPMSNVTHLRFGGEDTFPAVVPGSVTAVNSTRPQYSLPHVAAGSVDAPEVTIGILPYSALENRFTYFQVSLAFDQDLFTVLRESAARDHRGGFLDQYAALSETARYGAGFFVYSYQYPPGTGPFCGILPNFHSQPQSFVKLRLSRKSIATPGGGSAPVAGGPFPLEFKPARSAGLLVGENKYTEITPDPFTCQVFFSSVEYSRTRDGSIIVGDSGVRLEVSSADVEVFEPARITVSLDAPVQGITEIAYTLKYDPGVVSIDRLEDGPEVLAKAPRSSTFEERAGEFTHTIIFDPLNPLAQAADLPLAIVTFRPVGEAGSSSRLELELDGNLRPVVVFPVAGHPVAYVPRASAAGEVRVKSDPGLLRYRVTAGRAPPASTVVASVHLAAGAAGARGVIAFLAHDASGTVEPAYLGLSDLHLGSALMNIPGIVHSLDEGPGGLRFEATWPGDGLPRGDHEVLRVAYRVDGRYGDAIRLDLTAPSGIHGYPAGEGGGGGLPDDGIPVENLGGGAILLTDELAAGIAPEDTPADLRAVAVTELGWRWGFTEGSAVVSRFAADGTPLGPGIELPAPPRRISNGGEGWAWASLPGAVAILRVDGIEDLVDIGGEPWGIAVDRERNAWVAVAGATGRLVKLGRDGRILRVVTLPPPFTEPRDVALDDEGAAWVAHEGSDALSRVSADGTVVRPEAARLRSASPAGLTADGRGTIWASDAGDRSLLAFDLAGRETARIPLGAEPTDVSVDGAGDLWTVLEGEAGGRLVRVRPLAPEAMDVEESSTRHGDRTGLASLRIFVPEEDSDRDGIANLVEIRNATNPLDAADPPIDRSVLPVEDLEAVVLSVRIGSGGIENKVGAAWTNPQAYTRHEVLLDGQLLEAALPGDLTSAVLEGIQPGPSRLAVRSFEGNRSSPEAATAIQIGPGTSIGAIDLGDIEAVDLAVDGPGARRFVLDGRRNEVLVLTEAQGLPRRFAVPPPLGSLENVLTGIAYRPPAGGGAGGGLPGSDGSLIVLAGFSGRYQAVSTDGELIDGPWVVPFPAPGAYFTKLTFGDGEDGPRVFTVASGPQNDCIIFFRYGGDGPFTELQHPLASTPGTRFSLGGLAFDASGGIERLWVATGLSGEVLPRVALGVPLSGGGSTAKVFFNLFDDPGGTSHLRGIDLSPLNADFFALTSDARIHLLSDLGIAREDEVVPEIAGVAGEGDGGGGGVVALAGGPLEGGTPVVLEGTGFGADLEDLRVLFGDRAAEIIGLETGSEVDRLTVLSPPSEHAGLVPIFVFRTRGLDFRDGAFLYCPFCGSGALPVECQAIRTDCDGDGTADACQLDGSDCNVNLIHDACDIRSGRSRDDDADGRPDECVAFDRRDPNGDGEGNISDPLHVLGYLFLGNPAVLACEKSADSNGDREVDVSDPLFLLNFLFIGGGAPPAPSGQCGYDWTEEGLNCERHAACHG